jgi:hypothetical protein
MHAYSISSIPFYDARLQQYTKILSINAVPLGPLASRVKTVRPPRLSGLSGLCGIGNACCIHALTASSCGSGSGSGCGCGCGCGCGAFMTPEQLPELFAFLVSNGYAVDSALTKLAAKHQSGGGCSNANTNPNTNANALVCIVSYS